MLLIMTVFAECWLLPCWLLPGWLGAELPELLAPALRMTRIPLGSNTSSLSTHCCSTHFLGGPPCFDGRLWGFNPPVKCTGTSGRERQDLRPISLPARFCPFLPLGGMGKSQNLVKDEEVDQDALKGELLSELSDTSLTIKVQDYDLGP